MKNNNESFGAQVLKFSESADTLRTILVPCAYPYRVTRHVEVGLCFTAASRATGVLRGGKIQKEKRTEGTAKVVVFG